MGVIPCASVNIFLMFYQNVLRKRHEIGILKAFGCSRLRIGKIFLWNLFIFHLLGVVSIHYSPVYREMGGLFSVKSMN